MGGRVRGWRGLGRRVGLAAMVVSMSACSTAGGPLDKTPPPGAQRSYTPWPSPTGPQPTPEPNVTTVYSVPAAIATASHPVFWTTSAGDSLTLVAYDWDGVRRGTLQLSRQTLVLPSPDGTRIAVHGAAQVAGATEMSRFAGGATAWAHDDEHICAVEPRGGAVPNPFGAAVPGTLSLVDAATGKVRHVADFGSYGPHSQPALLACSAADDVAVVAEQPFGQYTDLAAIRLSTGAPATASLPGNNGTRDFALSPDGRFIGIGSSGRLSGPPGFEVRDVATGRLLETIVSLDMVAFSDDGTRMLTVTPTNDSSVPQRFTLIDWRTGRALWSGLLTDGTHVAQPHGGGFAVGDTHWVDHPGQGNRSPLEDLTILRADGSVAGTVKDTGPIDW